MNHKKTSVLIVGAGPSGLVMALWLKKAGIDFCIIDKNQGPGETSRALAIQARTLEFYRQLGISESVKSLGISAQEIKMRRFGKVIARIHLGALGNKMSPFPYLLFCAQDLHEKALCLTLEKLGVEIKRKTELTSFTQTEGSVTAKMNSPNGEEIIEADYLVGCDGAHSTVRNRLGIDFPGGTYSQIFFVADVITQGGFQKEGVQVSVSKKDFCIVMPIKVENSVRLTGMVPPESEKKEKLSFDDVSESVRENTGLEITKVNWFSTYHVHHRVVEHFKKGNVFLVGDAAHIHSPAGGQGMNTGIGDAVNLSWKLAEVIQNHASKKLLESYEPERLAFAKILVSTTDTAFQLIASRSLIGSVFRAYILPTLMAQLSRTQLFLKLAFKTLSQTRIHYRNSFMNSGRAGKIFAGDRLPWIHSEHIDNFEPLKSLAWQVHVYGKINPELHALTQSLNIPFHAFEWNQEFKKAGFLENALYLVRPDGYVGFASETQNTKTFLVFWNGLKGN